MMEIDRGIDRINKGWELTVIAVTLIDRPVVAFFDWKSSHLGDLTFDYPYEAGRGNKCGMRIVRFVPELNVFVVSSTDSFFVFDHASHKWSVTLNPDCYSDIHFLDYSNGVFVIAQTHTDELVFRDMEEFLSEQVHANRRGRITHRKTHPFHLNGAVFMAPDLLLTTQFNDGAVKIISTDGKVREVIGYFPSVHTPLVESLASVWFAVGNEHRIQNYVRNENSWRRSRSYRIAGWSKDFLLMENGDILYGVDRYKEKNRLGGVFLHHRRALSKGKQLLNPQGRVYMIDVIPITLFTDLLESTPGRRIIESDLIK